MHPHTGNETRRTLDTEDLKSQLQGRNSEYDTGALPKTEESNYRIIAG
jgi:hypothetical protein